jgi:hypothetical protein
MIWHNKNWNDELLVHQIKSLQANLHHELKLRCWLKKKLYSYLFEISDAWCVSEKYLLGEKLNILTLEKIIFSYVM